MVSENEESTRDTYEAFLKHEGHDVITTSDGQECIEVYKKEFEKQSEKYAFDIVLLDYQIPKKNGAVVAKEILALNAKQKILIATGHSRGEMNEVLKFDSKSI